MPSIQSLKKRLRGVRSTQKLTKAMRSVSAAKFSRLHGAYVRYAEYGRQCRAAFEGYRAGFLAAVPAADPDAPPLYVVLAGNRGMCGSFNTELLKFAQAELDGRDAYRLIACGKKAIRYFQRRHVPLEAEWVLDDEPAFEQSSALLDEIVALRRTGRVSGVYVIYPRYDNMLTQTPVVCRLFPAGAEASDGGTDEPVLCLPDRETLIENNAATVFHAMFYELVLSSALGAQAATLMTMRVAYDAATEYCARLEGEISRKRQSAVTADVIEIASGEHGAL